MASPRSHEELVQDALQSQRAVLMALHTAGAPEWLHLDLTMAQLKALLSLSASGTATVGQLADSLCIGKPAASLLVDRLVHLGLVTRTEDSADRRRALTRLSPAGEELVTRLRQGGRGRMRAWLLALSDEDLAALAQGLHALALAASAECHDATSARPA